MKIKTKLTLGVGLLFALIALLAGIGIRYIHLLKSDTENILVANYNTLEYTKNMLHLLGKPDKSSLADFEKNLSHQELNITEPNENEATSALRNTFEKYKTAHSPMLLDSMKDNIIEIMHINMNAIEKKAALAEATASKATLWIAIAGSFCFIIAFSLLINLPSTIANPISEITESIKQIAYKNYSERVHFENHNEFGDLAKSFNTMAQKLEEYNNSNLAKLMTEKKRIEALIDNMQYPVIGLDENQKVIFINEEALKIVGLSRDNIIGQPALELSNKNDLLKRLISSESEFAQQKHLKIYANNKESYFEKEIINTPIQTENSSKQLMGYVIILKNITEYKELDSAKTNFIANVSHELKTPIASIGMSVSLLEREQVGTLSTEQQKLLNGIKDDTKRLLNITKELLNVTQVESGNIQLSLHPYDPKEILNYAISTNQIAALQKQIVFTTDYPEQISMINIDGEKIAWVLTNIISNAVRYSPENSEITALLKETDKNIVYIISDNGRGIEDKYKDKIFERYFRIPGSQQKEGTGLGLAIGKEFIEAQGGSINVESGVGKGSSFIITLAKG